MTEKIDARRLIATYQTIFNSIEGKIILEDLEHTHFIHAPTVSDKDEGERCVVLRIKRLLATDPASIVVTEKGEMNHV